MQPNKYLSPTGRKSRSKPSRRLRVRLLGLRSFGFQVSGSGFTLSQRGHARRGSWCEVGVERNCASRKQRRNQLTEPRTSKTLLAVRNLLFWAARWLPDTTPSSPSLHKVRPAQIENWPWTRGADAGWQDHFSKYCQDSSCKVLLASTMCSIRKKRRKNIPQNLSQSGSRKMIRRTTQALVRHKQSRMSSRSPNPVNQQSPVP